MDDFRVRNKVFGTYPSVFHHPGRIGDGNRIFGIVQLKKLWFDLIGNSENGFFWDQKENLRFKIPTPSQSIAKEIGDQVTVIFVTNLKEPGSGPRSLDYFGIPYRILGSNIKVWSSNGLKIKLLNQELPNIKTKYFMLLDANDTFVISDLSRVLDLFENSFDCDMLLNAGQNLWPHWLDEMKEFQEFCDQIGDQVGSAHRYVNTGALIAKTDFYKEIVQTFDIDQAPLPGDDQAAFYPLYKKYYPKIQLDYYCQIFQCEFDEEILIESSLLPWYRKYLIHSQTRLYPFLKNYASFRRRFKHYFIR